MVQSSGLATNPIFSTFMPICFFFRASDVPFSKLEDIYTESQAMGGVAWVFQISQLKLNPPLGVTVPQIAEFLR